MYSTIAISPKSKHFLEFPSTILPTDVNPGRPAANRRRKTNRAINPHLHNYGIRVKRRLKPKLVLVVGNDKLTMGRFITRSKKSLTSNRLLMT